MIPLRVPRQGSSAPIATYAVFALNALSWAVLQTLGNDPGFTASICKYALWPGALWEHGVFDAPADCVLLHATPDTRPVTLFTSMFLHGGWLHLIVNMWYLLVLAPHVEERSGSPSAFLLFYLACGLGAAAAQIAIDPTSMIPNLGASGAIAGLLGAYVVLSPRIRILLLFPIYFIPVPLRIPAAQVAVAWFAVQVLGGLLELLGRGGEIAYGAHVGGFVTGVSLSLLYVLYQQSSFNRSRRGGGLRSSTRQVGIDLGTSNGCVAVMDRGNPRIIENSEGGRTIPTVLSFVNDGSVVVGERAKRQAIDVPEHTMHGVKRFLGRRCTDDMNGWRVPYKLKPEPETGGVAIETPTTLITPQQALAHVLTTLKSSADTHFGRRGTCTEAVVAVPACYNHLQRQATLKAACIAGLDVIAIISDPVAAVLTYCNDKRIRKGTVVVLDLGGGSCDVAIVGVDLIDGKQVLRMHAHGGDTLLGGEDFDQLVVDYIADEFQERHGIDLRDSSLALHRLKEASERAKIELSFKKTARIELPHITSDTTSDHKHIDSQLTRSKFESSASALVDRIFHHCDLATLGAGSAPEDIDAVILVGRQTCMPLLDHRVRQHFGCEVHRPADFTESVAKGAAAYAAALAERRDTLQVVEANPQPITMDDLAGNVTTLIERNAPLPAESKLTVATVAPDQTSIAFRILQGSRHSREENASLGLFELQGIPASSKGERAFEVRFTLDANGILDVSARNPSTGEDHPIAHRPDPAQPSP